MSELKNPSTLQTLLNNGAIKQDTYANAMSKIQPQEPLVAEESVEDPYEQKMQKRNQFFQQLNPASQEKVATATAIGVPLNPGESIEQSVVREATRPDGDIEEQTKILENQNKFQEADKAAEAVKVAAEEALRIKKYDTDLEKVRKYNEQAQKSGLPLRPEPLAQDYGIKSLPATPEEAVAASMPTTKDVEEAAKPEKLVKAQLAAQEKEAARTAIQAEETERKVAAVTKDIENKAAQAQAAEDEQENPMGNTFWDRLRMSVAIGLGNYSQATTGAENPALLMLKKKYEAIENKKKLTQEERIAREKMDLDRATLELKKMDSQTDNQYKKAQIAKIMGEVGAERVKKEALLRIAAKSKMGGLGQEDIELLDDDTKKRVVRLPNGNYALAFNEKASERFNKYESEISPAISGAKRVLDIANDPKFSKMSLEDRARVAVEIKALVGQLRLPFTGPGQLTEKEYDRLLSTVGDPSSLAALPHLERIKLQTLVNKLQTDLKGQYKAVGVDIPLTREEKEIEFLVQQNPDIPRFIIEQNYNKAKAGR
jgi:hypothetical protein